MRACGMSSKKFKSRVLPGALLVRASAWRCAMALMALDLPAFERPAKATSLPTSGGNCAGAAALTRNRASGNRLMLRAREPQAAAACSVQFAAVAQIDKDAEKLQCRRRRWPLAHGV